MGVSDPELQLSYLNIKNINKRKEKKRKERKEEESEERGEEVILEVVDGPRGVARSVLLLVAE